MIEKRKLITLAVMAVLLSLAAAPALAETKNGPLVLVRDDGSSGSSPGEITKFDPQAADSGANNIPKAFTFTAPPYGKDPEVTPDGRTVVYAGDNNAVLYSVPMDKSVAPTRLTTNDQNYPNATQEFPTVSPDGQTVYFQYTAWDDNGNTLINDVYAVPIEGGDITRVTNDNRYHYGLEITPDGEHFVYSHSDTIYVQPVSGGPATPLHRCRLSACDPAVSPDGTKIAFVQVEERTSDRAIYTVPLSTTGGATPTKVAGSEVPPFWSFVGSMSSRPVYFDPMVAFSPNGKYIAYSIVFQGFGECPLNPCGYDEVVAKTRVIPVEGGNYTSIEWSDGFPQTQVAWAPASSDTTAPQLTLPDITVEATSRFGTTVTLSSEARPTDDVDPNPALSCTKLDSSGRRVLAFSSGFPIGTTTVTCTAEDASGNKSTDSFDVTVRDTTPPAITGMPSDFTSGATGPNGTVVSWDTPTARDLVDGTRSVNCEPASGTTFALGTTTVSCTATDSRNNSATRTFKVNVAYDWSGVLQPVNVDGSSIFTLGSVVPVQFALTNSSAGITDVTAKFTYRKIDDRITGTVLETTSKATPTAGNLFRYDAASNQYVYYWATKGLAEGTYELSIDFGDGTVDNTQAKNHVLVSLKKK